MRLAEAQRAIRGAVGVTRLDVRPDRRRRAALGLVCAVLENVLVAVNARRHGSECAA